MDIHDVCYSGTVTSVAKSLVELGVPQNQVDVATVVRLWNHSSDVNVIFLSGPPASPPPGPYTKRDVLGVGLVEDLPADTPVAAPDNAIHGERLGPCCGITIRGAQNIRRLRLVCDTTARFSVVMAGGKQ